MVAFDFNDNLEILDIKDIGRRQSTQSTHNPNPNTITNRNSHKIHYCKPLQCKLYRVFNNGKFNHGGRFYGAEYQQLSGKTRGKMLINGQPVIEVDYSAFHTRMLYHMEEIDLQTDPYDIYNGVMTLRAAVKLIVNMAINAENKQHALGAFYKKVYLESEDDKEKYSPIIKALKKYNLKPGEIYDRFITLNPTIEKYISSGFGIQLQYEDSEIASKILNYFTKKGVPCLCVHDSFIVQKRHKDELVQVMKEFYKVRFHFDPTVAFK